MRKGENIRSGCKDFTSVAKHKPRILSVCLTLRWMHSKCRPPPGISHVLYYDAVFFTIHSTLQMPLGHFSTPKSEKSGTSPG